MSIDTATAAKVAKLARIKVEEDALPATDGSQQDKVLKNAPDAREGFFVVPKVVE
ncbi:MAG: aspartyl/glutamyl-tRNA amidotransferase subunit C [Rhodobacteraceae bacterium]|nr:aspartyl/glutamyl-tRNA amidotransferase subunit C [Paracoccaceae bacterium]